MEASVLAAIVSAVPVLALAVGASTAPTATRAADGPGRWPAEKANAWLAQHGWLIGCNYIPSTAINQLEMWQAETWEESTIDRELGCAESLGFNSVRVFLHDLLWQQDAEGFARRIERFLELADKHKIGVLLVLFDSCWNAHPKLGPQPAPIPHTHNSGWVQSPGIAALQNASEYPRLRAYVSGVVGRFAQDKRIHGWDLWNEPENGGGADNKVELVTALLPQVYAWAREASPSQPLTSGVWSGDWSDDAKLNPIQRTQLANSDVISFHSYAPLEGLRHSAESLRRFGRPLLCTEFMARPSGSTFDPHAGWMKEQQIAAYCWGFVAGKSQTIYPWDSWKKKYDCEPPVWFHDVLRADGTPYSEQEASVLRALTKR